ncbi:HAD-like domain-containing protein [Xylariomycetidae sp. FL2044]|nr:HAD-like domain-containing protein [Xylariomycetidae sp. FL2044]
MLSRAIARTAHHPALYRTAITASSPISRFTLQASSTQFRIGRRGMANNKKPTKKPPSSSTGNPQQDQKKPSSPPEAQAPGTESSNAKPDMSSLPDLTQGIPSTLEFETSGATNKAELRALEETEDPEPQSGGGRGKGELPASAYISSTEKRRLRLANIMYACAAGIAFFGIAYLGRDWDEEEAAVHTDIPNGWSAVLWWKRAMARMSDVTSYYKEPAFDKLLPDVDPMFERPYTLCISLEDMLVHSEWSREHGWRIAKRPGVDYFLRYLSQYYELVLFTSVPFAMGDPLVRKLDPYHIIMWPLFREATKYKDGEIVKDLSYLNRDLSKVIIIDSKASHVQSQPENAIVLPPWKGDPNDKELVSLIPFLEYIHTMQYADTRKVLEAFKDKHIPTEFARREAIARREFQKQFEAEKKARRAGSGMGALGSLLGLKPSNMSMMVPVEGEQSPSEAFAQGKMLQDIARERGRRNYEMMEKEIRENGEKWLKEEQMQQEKMQQEAMAGMKSSFTGWFVPSKPADNPNQSETK